MGYVKKGASKVVKNARRKKFEMIAVIERMEMKLEIINALSGLIISKNKSEGMR